jgi:hypothetical protein
MSIEIIYGRMVYLNMKAMARPKGTKYIETPEKMWDLFLAYKEEIKTNPIRVEDYVGKDGDRVYREKDRPLTIEGFKNYCRRNVGCVNQYLVNQDNLYDDYITICSHIKDEIRQNQIEGGMVGIYNPSITQRLNNLKEQTENTNTISIPQLPDIGNRKK